MDESWSMPIAPCPAGAGPLAGLVVLDLTRVLAGPYCTMMLGDMGARIIKIERPGHGDDSRHIGPFLADGTSCYNFYVNRNKESLALDLRNPDDLAILRDLTSQADVLVENFTPGVMDKLGLGWEAIHALNPRLVYASISGFGQTGPMTEAPAYDIIVQAMGGIMSLTGHPDGKPTRVGVSIGDIAAGMFAATAVLAALHARGASGVGSRVDVAMLDAQVALLENAFSRMQITGSTPGPIGSRHPSIAPFGVFAAADGELVIATANNELFRKLLGALGIAAADPRFATNDLRCQNFADLKSMIEEALRGRTCATWLAHFRALGIPCGPVNDVAQVAKNPQVLSRGMLREMPTPTGQPLLLAASPMRIGDLSPQTQPFRPAPRLNQHREAILAELYAAP